MSASIKKQAQEIAELYHKPEGVLTYTLKKVSISGTRNGTGTGATPLRSRGADKRWTRTSDVKSESAGKVPW
jgi:hypothetical protein